MDKNVQYAIRKGHPIVKIALTLEDANELLVELSQDSDTIIIIRFVVALRNAIKQLGA